MAEPQITVISSYFADQFRIDGVDPADATEAWRSALRYARQTGTVAELTELIERTEPEDSTLRELCASLRR
jgi:hypothetical protein